MKRGSDINQTAEIQKDLENSHESDEDESQIQKEAQVTKGSHSEITLNFALYTRNHSGTLPNFLNTYNKKLLFSIHPTYNLFVSVGEDMNLCLWDAEKCKLITMRNIGLMPSAIKFTPDGELLAIGFINGALMLLDAKITMNTFGKFNESKNIFYLLVHYN